MISRPIGDELFSNRRSAFATPLALFRLAGRAFGRTARRTPRRAARSFGLEPLEGRTLLEGSFATALPISFDTNTLQGQLGGSINPAQAGTDNDYFQFITPGAAGTKRFISVLADTQNEIPASTLNTRVQIFAETDLTTPLTLGSNNGQLTSGFAKDGWAGFIANAGTKYFVIVSSDTEQGPANSGTYTLRVNAFNGTVTIDPATGIGIEGGQNPLNGPRAVWGKLDRLQQDVLYTITVPNDQSFNSLATLDVQSTQAALNARLDTHLEVYRAAGTNGVLVQVASDSDAGRLNDAFVGMKVNPGETLYVRVRSDEIRPGLATTPNGLGVFWIVSDFKAGPTGRPLDPVTRRTGDIADSMASFIAPTTNPPAGNPRPAFQTASYNFTAQGTGLAVITVTLSNPADPFAVVDPAVRIFDSNGTLLGFNDNFVVPSTQPFLLGTAELQVRLVGGQKYFIVVDAFAVTTGVANEQLFNYNYSIEADHTFDPLQPIDDGVDVPADGLTPDERRRLLEESAGLVFNDPFLTPDRDGNDTQDRGYRQTSRATGRLHGLGDTDVFQFTTPVDMLGRYAGNNDDSGSSLFVGGRFDIANPDSIYPTASRTIASYDANDWWHVGPQKTTPGGTPLGFFANTATSAKPEIYAMYNFGLGDFSGAGTDANADQTTRRILVIGGDFRLVFQPAPDTNPEATITVRNIAAWEWRPGALFNLTAEFGRFNWISLGSANAPVRAITGFDPEGYDSNGDRPGGVLPDPSGPMLVVGGDFTNIGGVNANHLASRTVTDVGPVYAFGGWTPLGDAGANGVTGGAGSVRALAVYDPPDPGAGQADSPGPPPVPEVADPADAPRSLWVGGDFTTAGTVPSRNLAFWTGQLGGPDGDGTLIGRWNQPNIGSPADPWAINGTVSSLTVTNVPDLFDPPPAPPPPPGQPLPDNFVAGERLIVGGNFTAIGGAAYDTVMAGQLNSAPNRIAMYGRIDPTPPPNSAAYKPRLVWDGIATGFDDGEVLTLTNWTPPAALPGQPAVAPVLVAGGSFVNNGDGDTVNHISYTRWGNNTGLATQWRAMQFGPPGTPPGTNGTVRSLTTFADAQEVGVPNTQNVLYLAGDFSVANTANAFRVAAVYFNGGYTFDSLGDTKGGVGNSSPTATPPSSVFSIANYAEVNPYQWDHHDRPASKLQIDLSPDLTGVENLRLRVYDSQFTLLYENDRYTPINQGAARAYDPAGSLDPSVQVPNDAPNNRGYDTQLEGPSLWGGEVYYIVVSDATVSGVFPNGAGTGRYSLTVTIDSLSPDIASPANESRPAIAKDGAPDQINGFQIPETTEGNFSTVAPFITNIITGNTDNTTPPSNIQPSPFNVQGNYFYQQFINPSTPSLIRQASTLGEISTITDTDLWSFRANFTGTAEVRTATLDLPDAFGETIINLSTNPPTEQFQGQTKTYDSALDTALRIFDNDFSQLSYNDDNAAIQGDVQTIDIAGVGARFQIRDSRVVFNVVAGNTYFVQVESGQRYKNALPPLLDQRTPNVDRETDWRYATGSYRLFIHAMPFLQNDTVNGQLVQDDHVDNNFVLGTVVPIGDRPEDAATNGKATLTGSIINTPQKPADTDLFQLIAPGSGTLNVRVTRTGATNTLNPQLTVFNAQGNPVATGTLTAPGDMLATLPASAGQKFYIAVAGNGGSQGAYALNVSGVPNIDDHADFSKWSAATDVRLIGFRGAGVANGRIEAAGDSDIFRFQVTDFAVFTVDVNATTPGFDPSVTVYEVNEDLNGRPIYLRLAQNDNANAGTADSHATFPVTPNRSTGNPVRSYPYYYVVVRGADRTASVGSYTLTLGFPATDDHPDAALTGTADQRSTADFNDASQIPVDPGTGLGQLAGVIERNFDSDLFVFTAPASGSATVHVTRANGSVLRARLSVLANVAAGQPSITIATSVMPDAAGPQDISVTFNVARGAKYFIVVDPLLPPGANSTDTGAYNVSLATTPTDDHANAAEWDLATIIPINPATNTGLVGGAGLGDPNNSRINYAGDTDLFRFTSTAPGLWRLTLQPFGAGSSTFAPKISVFDTTTNHNLVVQFIGTLPAQQAVVQITGVLQGASYFVLIEGLAAGGSGAIGEYSLTIVGPTGGGGEPGGGTDPSIVVLDTDPSREIRLNPRTGSGERSDTIEVINDRDAFWFRTLSYSGTAPVFVQVVTPDGSLLDATVKVLRAPNELPTSVAFEDADGLPGVQAAGQIVDAPGNTLYWVIVDGVGASIGSYTVRVGTRPPSNRLFFPEGFTTDRTRETVAISNPNGVPVDYTINIWYETGDLLTSLPVGHVQGNQTVRVDLASAAAGHVAGLRTNTPYSVEIVSALPLAATLSHYDHNGGLGDSFSSTLSTTWNFARVQRSPGEVLDFIVFYNPSNFDVNVTLTAYQTGRAPISITKTWGALRRGGWAINDLPGFPLDTFSIVLTATAADSANNASFEGVVASLSHYDVLKGAAFGALGDQGATVQAIPSFTQSSTVDSEIILFNPNATTATVQITGSYVRATLTQFAKTVDIQPRSQVVLKGSTLGLIQGQPIGLRFASTAPVSVLADQLQKNDADAAASPSRAGTRFLFGDGFIDTTKAGLQNFETLNLYNPTGSDTTVSIRLLFADGTVSLITQAVAARSFAEVRLHERAEVVTQRAGTFAFGIDAQSPIPFAMTFTHYDLSLDGGWTAAGDPFGLTNPLARIP